MNDVTYKLETNAAAVSILAQSVLMIFNKVTLIKYYFIIINYHEVTEEGIMIWIMIFINLANIYVLLYMTCLISYITGNIYNTIYMTHA